jgi:hypothetical protein
MSIFGFLKTNKKKAIPIPTLSDLKQKTKILFVDDLKFNVVDSLKTKDGWKNIQRVSDVDSITQTEVLEAHVIFVDVQGVGKRLGFADEGLGLIVALKETYPEKKVVMYSAESKGQVNAFHQAADIVDGRLKKRPSRYEFDSTIERLAREAFCLNNCVEYLRKILLRDFRIDMSDSEIKEIVENLYNNGTYNDSSIIAAAFNLNNAGAIASIIQLLLMPFGI